MRRRLSLPCSQTPPANRTSIPKKTDVVVPSSKKAGSGDEGGGSGEEGGGKDGGMGMPLPLSPLPKSPVRASHMVETSISVMLDGNRDAARSAASASLNFPPSKKL